MKNFKKEMARLIAKRAKLLQPKHAIAQLDLIRKNYA